MIALVMNSGKRIALNAGFTYARSLLGMLLGVFSSRWLLEALGVVDYGLMSVVGSLIVFVTFLNTVAGGACSRFFAYSIGKNDIVELQRWFSVAMTVHTVLPLALIAFGWPLGEWAIDHWLVIATDRVATAHWVFRFSLAAAFWSMVSTPYMAMYTATQNIYERTLWDIAQTLIRFGFIWFLTFYTGDAWFLYSGFMVVVAVVLGLGQVIRAVIIFPGCRYRMAYSKDWSRIRQMMSFSGWTFFGSLGAMVRMQMPAVLLNRHFPPCSQYSSANASYSVGNALASYTQTLASALMGAFSPEITRRSGAGEGRGVLSASNAASKFGASLILLAAIPLMLESDFLLVLWLKKPPLQAEVFCRLVLLQFILDNLTFGHMAGILATGKIAMYQFTTGMLCVLSIPLAWLFLLLGYGPTSVSWAIAICVLLCSCARLYFGKKLIDLPISTWINEVFFPVSITGGAALIVGYVVQILLRGQPLLRMASVVASSGTVVMICILFVVCSKVERQRVIHAVLSKCGIKK